MQVDYSLEKTGNSMELLEFLTVYSGCQFISDLKSTTQWKVVLKKISEQDILINQFSLDEWKQALKYLKNEGNSGQSREAILQQLLKE
ncbi:hypothetical protein [Eubacterium sp.]|uniref:hypothetical protein n=1 Tax=Eubacterium sp. TaxID=142586 RepID=UPI002FC8925D